ncbi:phosphodiesterase [Marinobacter zhanjiangensis]|uniref:Phosphodiesterase n=1 Tax=Marinobacter zhanjiangensis TaxID=578215 RepID=A0ABQ3B8Y9_9GAMM|nr:phosphodiesterase [Marinobacter zhanjiangensis]GGY84951.1 hypothetical protein GCM10007071_35290 [Marinobacter zhanjiangensis]
MNKLMSAAMAASLAMTALGTGFIPLAQAEQVKVPVMSQGDRESIKLPDTGQTRETVRKRFGDPARTSGPVGDPPISQWHYDDFVVYFEYNHVIHTVARHSR